MRVLRGYGLRFGQCQPLRGGGWCFMGQGLLINMWRDAGKWHLQALQ